MPSNAVTGAGPIASTVFDPAAIWVRPASSCILTAMQNDQPDLKKQGKGIGRT